MREPVSFRSLKSHPQRNRQKRRRLSVVSTPSRLSFHPATAVAPRTAFSFCPGTAAARLNGCRFGRPPPCRPETTSPINRAQPSGKTLKVYVIAANDAGQAQPSETAQIVVP